MAGCCNRQSSAVHANTPATCGNVRSHHIRTICPRQIDATANAFKIVVTSKISRRQFGLLIYNPWYLWPDRNIIYFQLGNFVHDFLCKSNVAIFYYRNAKYKFASWHFSLIVVESTKPYWVLLCMEMTWYLVIKSVFVLIRHRHLGCCAGL